MDLVKSLIIWYRERLQTGCYYDTNLFLITDEIFNESNFYELDLKESNDQKLK